MDQDCNWSCRIGNPPMLDQVQCAAWNRRHPVLIESQSPILIFESLFQIFDYALDAIPQLVSSLLVSMAGGSL